MTALKHQRSFPYGAYAFAGTYITWGLLSVYGLAALVHITHEETSFCYVLLALCLWLLCISSAFFSVRYASRSLPRHCPAPRIKDSSSLSKRELFYLVQVSALLFLTFALISNSLGTLWIARIADHYSLSVLTLSLFLWLRRFLSLLSTILLLLLSLLLISALPLLPSANPASYSVISTAFIELARRAPFVLSALLMAESAISQIFPDRISRHSNEQLSLLPFYILFLSCAFFVTGLFIGPVFYEVYQSLLVFYKDSSDAAWASYITFPLFILLKYFLRVDWLEVVSLPQLSSICSILDRDIINYLIHPFYLLFGLRSYDIPLATVIKQYHLQIFDFSGGVNLSLAGSLAYAAVCENIFSLFATVFHFFLYLLLCALFCRLLRLSLRLSGLSSTSSLLISVIVIANLLGTAIFIDFQFYYLLNLSLLAASTLVLTLIVIPVRILILQDRAAL